MEGQKGIKQTTKAVRITKEAVIYLCLLIWTVINIFPVYWMFTFSLKSNKEIYGDNVIGLPKEWLWSNYKSALSINGITRYFLNSVFVTLVTVLIVMIVALMATFALTRFFWKGRKTMNAFFMLGLTIPIHSALVPIFKIFTSLKLTNMYISLIVPYAAFSLAMAILICTGFMQDIPFEMDEAACIDGCGTWRIFFTMIVPLMKPAVATVSIYTLLQCWNEFMFASIFVNADHATLPVGVKQLVGRTNTDLGKIGAALVLATFPMLIFYIFFSKKIQDSFIAGAVKG